MSLLVWKCCELGNPQTIRELNDLIRTQDFTVVFIAETWLDEARLKLLLKNLNFGQKHIVSKITPGGGLALF